MRSVESFAYDPVESPSARTHHVVKSRRTPESQLWTVMVIIPEDGKIGLAAARGLALNLNLERRDTSTASPGFLDPSEEFYRKPKPGEQPSEVIEGEPVVQETHESSNDRSHKIRHI